MARIARSLETLCQQVDSRWPNRSKANDGWIGDAAHKARSSDHNPNARGVVQALDITHDPRQGPDAGQLAEALRASCDDRIKYIISNRRISAGAGGPSPWVWRNYRGANPHDKHVHISVANPPEIYDNPRPWSAVSSNVSSQITDAAGIPASVNAVELKVVQEQLKRLNYPVGDIDGLYGPLTRAALLAFQADNHLPLTGVADAATVAALSPAPPRPLDMERVTATAALLLALGSGTIRQADRTKLVALISSVLGLLGIGNSAITQVAKYPPLSAVGTASPYSAPTTSELYTFLAKLIQAVPNPTSRINDAQAKDLTDTLRQLHEAHLRGVVSPENSQALYQLKALIPDALKTNPELARIFEQADRFRPANAQLRTIFDLMPSVFADGSVPQMMSDALATAASSIIPGFGGSLTMLGIGLAAHYFGNNIIQARVRDHATASNTRI